MSEQKLREVYLAPWKYLADGRGLRSVMAAQNMVNGRPMHCNKRLLTTILREEWNVTAALVESDGGDCIGALQYGFHAAATQEEAAIISLESGMDMDLGAYSVSTCRRCTALHCAVLYCTQSPQRCRRTWCSC